MPTPTYGQSDPDRPRQEEQARPVPVPDEDGPHDVPDDAVIERTLPARPGSGNGNGNGKDKMPTAD